MPGNLIRDTKAVPVYIADDDGNPVAVGGSGSGGGVVTQPTASQLNAQVVGNVAAASADSGNPVKIGGRYNTTFPTYTDGQRTELQTDTRGAPFVVLKNSGGTATVDIGVANGDANNMLSSLAVRTYGLVFNGSTWDRQRGDTNGTWSVATGSAAAAVGIVPTVAANASSLVVKASAGNFYGGSIVAGATAGFLIAYNAAAAPAAGASLTAAQILGVVQVVANGSAALGEYTVPDRFGTGIVLLFSTSVATYTVPANLAVFLRGRAM